MLSYTGRCPGSTSARQDMAGRCAGSIPGLRSTASPEGHCSTSALERKLTPEYTQHRWNRNNCTRPGSPLRTSSGRRTPRRPGCRQGSRIARRSTRSTPPFTCRPCRHIRHHRTPFRRSPGHRCTGTHCFRCQCIAPAQCRRRTSPRRYRRPHSWFQAGRSPHHSILHWNTG